MKHNAALQDPPAVPVEIMTRAQNKAAFYIFSEGDQLLQSSVALAKASSFPSRAREGWQARAQIPNADRTFPSTLPPPTGQYRPGERWPERPVLRARRDDVEAFPLVAVPEPAS